MAARNDTRLIILNREPTGLDPYADLVLHREIGVTLGEAVGNN
jgi:NAD-dependent deacetylase